MTRRSRVWIHRIIESLDLFVWKRPLRSSSPTFNPALPSYHETMSPSTTPTLHYTFTRVIPRTPTWVNSCSMTPESQYFGLHRDLRIWFYSFVNRKFQCCSTCIILRNPLHLDSIKMFDNARGFFRLCVWLRIQEAQMCHAHHSMGHGEQSRPWLSGDERRPYKGHFI